MGFLHGFLTGDGNYCYLDKLYNIIMEGLSKPPTPTSNKMSFFAPGLDDLLRIGRMQEEAYRGLQLGIGQGDYYRNLYREASTARMQPLERIAQKGFEDVEAYGKGVDISKRRPQEFATMQKASDIYKNVGRMTGGLGTRAFDTQGTGKLAMAQNVSQENIARALGGNLAASETAWRDSRLREALGAQATLLGEEQRKYLELPNQALQQYALGLQGIGSVLSGRAGIQQVQQKEREDRIGFFTGLAKTALSLGMG